eukprot:110295-Pelagomonas_calceolata.AAC.1
MRRDRWKVGEKQSAVAYPGALQGLHTACLEPFEKVCFKTSHKKRFQKNVRLEAWTTRSGRLVCFPSQEEPQLETQTHKRMALYFADEGTEKQNENSLGAAKKVASQGNP